MPNVEAPAEVSEFDTDLDEILYRVLNGHTLSPQGLRRRLSTIAEEHSKCYQDVVQSLKERFALRNQAGEYTDTMVKGIPLSLHPLLGINGDSGV
jgi:hypothetical protein